jgi:hypothetical protein
MNIQLPKNIEQFNIKDVVIAGDDCILVTPKDMGVDWDDENKYFRSSIWRKADMHPISLGWKKFMNLGEKPSFEPIDDYTDLEFLRKVDGSLIIASQYKGELIVRTRGTVDASKLENGHEIELLKKKYPKAFDNIWLKSENYSLLYEWTTPSNRIVLRETDVPSLWLIGIVIHKEAVDPFNMFMGVKHTIYKYFNQFELDQQESYLGVPRPARYKLDLASVAEYLKDKDNMEGVVVYANDGQYLKKIKTPRYLYMHKMFTGIKNINHIVGLWIEYGCTYRENFELLIATHYDWELVESLKNLIDEMFKKWADIQARLDIIRTFVNQNRELSRKEIALKILTEFGPWASVAFEVLDNKSHKTEKLFELIENVN